MNPFSVEPFYCIFLISHPFSVYISKWKHITIFPSKILVIRFSFAFSGLYTLARY